MKRIYMHGTTQRGLDAILNQSGKFSSVWTCSDQDRMTYLWDVDAVMEGEGFDGEDGVIRQAFESAQCQAAVLGEDTTLYVLVMEFDEDEVDEDYSCENMADYARTVSESMVTRESIVRVYRCDFSKWDAPFVLAGLVGRDYFADCNVTDERLLTLAETLSKQQVYREELYEFDYQQCELPGAVLALVAA